MGAGVALQIRKKWPKVYSEYLVDCKSFKSCPEKMLGHVQDVFIRDGLVVANCFGQVRPGKNGCMTDCQAWDVILDKLSDLSNYFSLDLNFPWMVGCGLAGGSWDVMLEKIEKKLGPCSCKAFIHKLS